MAVVITATAVSTVFPPRVTLSVTGLTVGQVVSIQRQVSGARTSVRGADDVTMTDVALLAVDSEFPFGTPVSYVAVVNDVDSATAGPNTYALPNARAVLSDAISGQGVAVKIVEWAERSHDRESSVFHVGGRTVVVSRPRGMFTARIVVMTETEADRVAMDSLLDSATDGVLLLRQDGTYTGVDCYVTALRDTEQRVTNLSSQPRRRWALDVVETQAWAPELDTLGFTFANFDTAYTGLTFTQFDTDFAGQTFLQFDLADWS